MESSMGKSKITPGTEPDVVLIGAGIMSATLGVLLKELQPELSIEVFERLEVAAAESSDAWNNAGTGHTAYCELNYTPEKDGIVETSKAVKIAESFELSKQFWAYLVAQNHIKVSEPFISSIPHISFVWGEKNVAYLRKRYEALQSCHLFDGMEYSENHAQLAAWMPLVMEGRDPNQKVAATRMKAGTDVNFGALTRNLFQQLTSLPDVHMHFNHDVRNLKRSKSGGWEVKVKDKNTGGTKTIRAKFVFIGAGGGSLHLLEKSDIPEGRGFGGFPVSGQWLKCTNPAIIEQHQAKVYGKASVGAPPMSVPHLDTRMIDGQKALLFGPYAGFSTKFLKEGSYWDLPSSIKASNVAVMISAGLRNIPLTKYLIQQVMQSSEDRLNALKEYYPDAVMADWKLEIAGQRVQVIKKDVKNGGGVLEFGTEVVSAADGSIAALLGASPGASTAVAIMLDLLERCFKDKINTPEWQQKLKQMIPSYGQSLASDAQLAQKVSAWSSEVLGV